MRLAASLFRPFGRQSTAKIANFAASTSTSTSSEFELSTCAKLRYAVGSPRSAARVYQYVSDRFHLADWHRIIDEKLRALDSLYSILKQDQMNKWMMIAACAA